MPCQPAPPSSHPRSTAAPAVPSRRNRSHRPRTHPCPSTAFDCPDPPTPPRCSRVRWTDMGASSGGGNGSCIRLHRSAHSASPPAAAPERATAQVRPDLGALLARRLVADRGDVPGWVLITLMTAAIVVALWAVASEQILQIFNNAMAPFLGTEL